jgi:competence protein ComEA
MNLLKANILPLGLGFIGLIFIIIGLFQIISKPKQEPLEFETVKGEESKSTIMVDIEGAVINPGVYELDSDSRIVDLLAAAGGLSEDADREHVQRNVNLAQKASDGLKVYIPRVGEEVLSLSASSGGAGPVVNINTASQLELEALPGIGQVTASKIVEGRPYASIDELLDKKVIGQSAFEKLKDQIAAN